MIYFNKYRMKLKDGSDLFICSFSMYAHYNALVKRKFYLQMKLVILQEPLIIPRRSPGLHSRSCAFYSVCVRIKMFMSKGVPPFTSILMQIILKLMVPLLLMSRCIDALLNCILDIEVVMAENFLILNSTKKF